MDHVQKLCYFARGYGKVEFKIRRQEATKTQDTVSPTNLWVNNQQQMLASGMRFLWMSGHPLPCFQGFQGAHSTQKKKDAELQRDNSKNHLKFKFLWLFGLLLYSIYPYITYILSIYYLNMIHILSIYYPNIIHILSIYYPHIIHILSIVP